MMEHAQFIRGLLDPTECRLIESADEFANRLARDPRTWKVFSSKVHGDPAQVQSNLQKDSGLLLSV